MNTEELTRQALAIWRAGVDAVDACRLVRQAMVVREGVLSICGLYFPLDRWKKIAVLGAGKAGAGMALGLLDSLGPDLVRERVTGWINVPADCVRPLAPIVLHPARPAGLNEPTSEGVWGSEQILRLAAGLEPDDLCVVLLSGGGSALLPAPIEGVSLAAKQQVTRYLMQAGATIQELNAVRKRLSRVKGGGLARAIAAGATETLIISDVVGDPLDVIASGPTAPDSGTAELALAVLRKFRADPPTCPAEVRAVLERLAAGPATTVGIPPTVRNHVIGSNQVALAACAAAARKAGFRVLTDGSQVEGEATDLGRQLARRAAILQRELAPGSAPWCLLSGGEPVVRLAPPDRRGKGGRNQQLALAALDELFGSPSPPEGWRESLVVLSGGTDGEDGPTDAAGACANASIAGTAARLNLNARDHLDRNDAYRFFEAAGGLLKTGPTHTNVMDLRVVLVGHP